MRRTSVCLVREDGKVESRTEARFSVPVTESQVLASASLNEHHLGAEEQLLHDVYEQPRVQLRVGEALGQLAAVLDQLVATGNAVSVQVQDGNAQGGAGGLIRAGEGESDSEVRDQSSFQKQLLGRNHRSHFKRLETTAAGS